MYGDEKMFASVKKAPYLPFYYGDRGFRFFTTHGQWRDLENSRAVDKTDDLPGWSAKDGWNSEIWQELGFSPFLLPCFGDTVAAGVLSTFIYKVKKQLKDEGIDDPELNSVIDELDLYRPTYAALTRILQETGNKREKRAIEIIEDTIYVCIIDWLSWDFTYQTSPFLRRIGLKAAKIILEFLNSLGHDIKIKAIAGLLKVLAFFSNHHEKKLSLKEMKGFPGFMQAYRHYGFQIHGEGHTHHPLQEELNIKGEHPSTYINLGTWRDQLIPRKNQGYRRRGVLRALFILDLYHENNKPAKRSFDYFVQDVIRWSDDKDALDKADLAQTDTLGNMP
jgi:UDP-2,3-diacylglucosamine pyrophosphatase LpxH